MENTRFFTVSNNIFNTSGVPWIQEISEGLIVEKTCNTCLRTFEYPKGDITVVLESETGTKWSDVLGCGHYPLLIVSCRVIEAFEKEKLLSFPYHKVYIEKPYPKRLDEVSMPDYYWIDGPKMLGAKLNFQASKFVECGFCPECGTREIDQIKTFELQDKGYSYIFKNDTWNNSDLFVTDLSDTLFFCTDKILDCAKKYNLSNFRFIPVETANDLKGINYLK